MSAAQFDKRRTVVKHIVHTVEWNTGHSYWVSDYGWVSSGHWVKYLWIRLGQLWIITLDQFQLRRTGWLEQ